jgi:acyl carrier protein
MENWMRSEAAIRDWCVAELAQMLDRPAAEIDAEAPWPRLGVDSATATWFIVALEEWLEVELDPERIFECASIAALAHHLAAD